jgi:hypothetical protein
MRAMKKLPPLLIAFAAVAFPAAALAAPPPNDNRANAQSITIPGTADGTTVEATREENEPFAACSSDNRSVWYRVTTANPGRVILDLAAAGDLDAGVDVYRVRRSQLDRINCAPTDDRGRARLDFPTAGGERFLIRVAPQANSVDDTFRLTLRQAEPDPTPPGSQLPRDGATGELDRLTNRSDAYSVVMRAGTTYRVNLATRDQCARLSIFPPGTSDFNSDSPVRSVGCRGYTLFTPGPGESGRYSLLAHAPSGTTNYRLTAARAGSDDTAPGRFMRNYQRERGQLNARRIDVVDLYRFDVERRSDLELRLQTSHNFTVVLLTAGGKRVSFNSGTLRQRVRRGRYFAVVRAERGEQGSYVLRRVTRTITRTRTTFDGRRSKRARPGETVGLTARVRPGTAGPVAIQVERFDPVAGWQFFRTYRRRTSSDGRAVVPFAPAVGKWRARTEFLGNRGSSPSESGYALLKVRGPLDE